MKLRMRLKPGYTRHGKWTVLTDAAFRFAHKILDWCVENGKDFVPASAVTELAGTAHRGRKLALELEQCGAHFDPPRAGLLDKVDGGWTVHDFWDYVEEVADDGVDPGLSAVRARAGRLGGIRSVEARRAKYGSAQPATNEAGGEQTGEADGEANPKHEPPSAPLPPTPPLPSPTPSDPKQPADSKTLQVVRGRARGQRPFITFDHFAEKKLARDWQFSDEFSAYASELGLTENQFADVVADFREKLTRLADEPWLGSQLCRFIEQRAERNRRAVEHESRGNEPPAVWQEEDWEKPAGPGIRAASSLTDDSHSGRGGRS